jgi:microcystin-dependent protein
MTSYVRAPVNFTARQRPTVGDQKISYTSYDHMGWLKCDGRSLDTTTYKILFDVIGYSFGGSGNNFLLPDMHGRVPGMAGTGTGLTPRTIGDVVGAETHTLTINEMPSHTHGSSNVSGNTNGNGNTTSNGTHTHGITDLGHTHTYLGVGSQNAASGADNVAENSPRPTETTSSNTTGITINSDGLHNHQIFNTGGSNAHNNMQPTLFTGNMFIYCGRNMDNYFPYQWVASSPGTVAVY